MKTLFAALVVFAIVAAQSQTTTPADKDMNAYITQRLNHGPREESLMGFQPMKPNEIRINGLIYSGITVELIKTDNPLQLINPLAPAEYGSSEDNTVHDPITGRASGLKLFSIQF